MTPLTTIAAIAAVKADRGLKKLEIEHAGVTVDVAGTAEAPTFSPSFRTPTKPYDEATFARLYQGKRFIPVNAKGEEKPVKVGDEKPAKAGD